MSENATLIEMMKNRLTTSGFERWLKAYEFGLDEFYNCEVGNYSFNDSELRKNMPSIMNLIMDNSQKTKLALIYDPGYADNRNWFVIELDELPDI